MATTLILSLLHPELNKADVDSLFPYMYTKTQHLQLTQWLNEPEQRLVIEKEPSQVYEKLELPSISEPISQPNLLTPTPIPIQKQSQSQSQSQVNHIFCPKQDNTLFWCVFVGIYGYTDYLNIGNKYNNAELEEKQTIMESLQKQPGKLKECNFRVTNLMIQELFSELMVCKRDQLFSLLAFTVYYNKTIYVVFENNTYLRFSPYKNTDAKPAADTTIIMYCRVGTRNNIYRLEQEVTDSTIEQIHISKLCLEHYTKPLRGVSSYKMDELELIAKKLALEIDGKWKKQELYEKIASMCSLEQVLKNS
jgi:hypothetical protein